MRLRDTITIGQRFERTSRRNDERKVYEVRQVHRADREVVLTTEDDRRTESFRELRRLYRRVA